MQARAPQERSKTRQETNNDKTSQVHDSQVNVVQVPDKPQYIQTTDAQTDQTDQTSLSQTATTDNTPAMGASIAGAQRRKPKQQIPRADNTKNPAPEDHLPNDCPVSPKTADSSHHETPPASEKTDTATEPEPESALKSKHAKQADDTTEPKTNKSGRLRFSPDETAPERPTANSANNTNSNRKLNKAQAQAERASSKLEKARNDLPAKRKLRKVGITDENTGVVRQKLKFEKTPVSQREHIRGALPLRPVKAVANTAIVNAHRKIYQVEHENTGVKAAHRAEIFTETGIRSALRHRKTAPYRKVAKLERVTQKKAVNLTYRRAIAENPKMHRSLLSRAMQKRKIKKDYAKAAREAQKSAKRAKRAGSAAADIGKSVIAIVKRNPMAAMVIVLVALLLFSMISLFSTAGSLGSGGLGSIVASTYLAEDAEMLAAEAAYAAMEANLQYELDNYALQHPGYDEYLFELDDIGHDPYVLISILSALNDGAWALDDVQGTLDMLFERQYTLTETVTVEVRYRTVTETVFDPETGEPTDVSTQVPYNYYICTVTLENFDLSHLPVYIMGDEHMSRYSLYMATLGNRTDLFPVHAYPNASVMKEYRRHDIPPEYFEDETFAAMMSEALKYLGMPYVWGGSKPSSSFDCSGYVSWVLNNSGWNVGRLGARALYGISTPVSPGNARPGDLVFFHSTYKTKTPGISHVGIYVGDGMMVHAGDPIGFADITTSYWVKHFYGYARP